MKRLAGGSEDSTPGRVNAFGTSHSTSSSSSQVSKKRSMDLSSLVVTSLEKGAKEELQSCAWSVPSGASTEAVIDRRLYSSITLEAPDAVKLVLSPSKKKILPIPETPTIANDLKEQQQQHQICSTSSTTRLNKRQSSVINAQITKAAKSSFRHSAPILCSGILKKQSTSGWRKTWNKRYAALNAASLCMFKSESHKNPHHIVALHDILHIGKEAQTTDGQFVFTLAITSPVKPEPELWRFGVQTESLRDDWRSKIATSCLLHEVGSRHACSAQRLNHLVFDCGAVGDSQTARGAPLMLESLWMNRRDVTSALLRNGVDARCLLRVDDETRGSATPAEIVQLLSDAGRDMNLKGDDVAQWTLLHRFVAKRDVNSVAMLLQRIDRPTISDRNSSKESALTLAVRRLSPEDDSPETKTKIANIVRLLLDSGADPSVRCGAGDTPFHLVCKRGGSDGASTMSSEVTTHFEGAKSLDINTSDASGDCPLHIAMKTGQTALARRLANDSRANLDLRDSSGDTTLMLAMKLNEESFACLLLAKSADGSKGASDLPIHLAIKMHMASLALKLIDSPPCEDSLFALDGQGQTPLHLAILHSLLGVAHALVSKISQRSDSVKKSALNSKELQSGDTALHLAVRSGRVDLARILVESDADFSVQNHWGETSLHACTRLVERLFGGNSALGAMRLFSRLLELDNEASKRRPSNVRPVVDTKTFLVDKVVASAETRCAAYYTARGSRSRVGAQAVIHRAAACENEQCGLWLIDALLKSSNRVDACTLDGALLTPLAVAIETGNAEIAKMLMDRTNLDSAFAGKARESYLHLAVFVVAHDGLGGAMAPKMLIVIEELMERGAYVGYWDGAGLSPLHLACRDEKCLPALRTILKYPSGAKHVDDRSEAGSTPLMMAVSEARSPMLIECLIKYGADVRLLEPKSRKGILRMCVQDSAEETGATLLRVVPEGGWSEDDDEHAARKSLMKRFFSGVVTGALGPMSEKRTSAHLSPYGSDDQRMRIKQMPIPESFIGDRVAPVVMLSEVPRVSDLSSFSTALDALENNRTSLLYGEGDDDNGRSPPFAADNGNDMDAYSKLSVSERIMAIERYQAQALESARVWIKTDAGKKMLSRIASVLKEGNPTLSDEAAMELAKRNFFAEHVKESVLEFEFRLKMASAAEAASMSKKSSGTFIEVDVGEDSGSDHVHRDGGLLTSEDDDVNSNNEEHGIELRDGESLNLVRDSSSGEVLGYNNKSKSIPSPILIKNRDDEREQKDDSNASIISIALER